MSDEPVMKAPEVLRKLREILSQSNDKTFRRKLEESPVKVLEEHGLNANNVSVSFLEGMTPENYKERLEKKIKDLVEGEAEA